MFAANSTSISAAGNGTRITSTLAINPTGKIRSWTRPSGNPAAGRGKTPEAIHPSGRVKGVEIDPMSSR